MNEVLVSGTVTKVTTRNKRTVVRLRIETETTAQPDTMPIVFEKRQAEIVAHYVTEAQAISVKGRLKVKNGRVTIMAEEFKMLRYYQGRIING